jgi:HD-like signal output (HDOD) protein
MAEVVSREERIEAFVQRLAASSELPAFARHVEDVVAIARQADAPLWQLTDAILKNVSLTAKVLRTVSSVHYNRSGDSVLSVSRAVGLLGVDAVRNLAAGMALFEHVGQSTAPHARELLLVCVLTAAHAERVARAAGYPRPEEAYLCGMFRPLGELLVACYAPGDYDAILAAMKAQRLTDAQASRHVLGFSYDDLGRTMAARWGLGETVARCMRQPDSFGAGAATESERLALAVEVGQELSAAVYRLAPEAGRARLATAVRRWGGALSLTDESVSRILGDSQAETRDIFAAAGVPLDRPKLGQQLAAMRPGAAAPPPAAVAPAPARAAAAPGETALHHLTDEVGTVLRSAERPALGQMMMMIVEAMYRGAGFDRVLFCLLDQTRSTLQARLGAGEGAAELVGKFRFPVAEAESPVRQAIGLARAVLVESVPESRYRRSALALATGARAFALLPIVVDGSVVGCIYADRLAAPLGLDAAARESLDSLCEHAGEVLSRRR